MKTVQVLGSGCARCAEAFNAVNRAVEEAGIEAKVEKVTDFSQIAALGVFSTPGIVVDGEVKVVGRVPGYKEILEWLK